MKALSIRERRSKARKALRLERKPTEPQSRATAASLGVGAGWAIRTQAEVARALGISRARVKQLEQSGLGKLRKALLE